MKIISSIAILAGSVVVPISALHIKTSIGFETNITGATNTGLTIQRMPGDSTDPVYRGLTSARTVFEFYQRRAGAVCWVTDDGLSILGDSLVRVVRNVRYFGLLPQWYHLAELELTLREINSNLRAEALLSDALLSIARDLKYGRIKPPARSDNDSIAIEVLERLAIGGSPIQSLEYLEPNHSGYKSLKAALKISLDSLTGAERDEWMTGQTFNSIPLHRTLQSVEINLERWRCEQVRTGLYIVINVPSFTLDVIEGNSLILSSRVIVGAPKTPTPLLSSAIECIVVYPYWHVPRKIAVEEYLPLIQQDSSYLTRHDFEILDRRGNILDPDSIDWAAYTKDYFPVTMRQREGPDNALGLLKFAFDNPYAVYLHDTNARTLFKDDYRAYSHGCIRLERAAKLAHFLVTGSIQIKSNLLDSAMQLQQRSTIELSHPVPILVRYYTCEVRDGKFHSYGDVYSLDEALVALLYKSDGSLPGPRPLE